jgi:hypothetical protein
MCWYSASHAEKVLEAEAGQRLVIRKVHGSSWAVRESDLNEVRPTPVCMLDRTKVLFRYSESEQITLQCKPEVEATFRMLSNPKRDVFIFADKGEVDVNILPQRTTFDVLEVPGQEAASALLHEESNDAVQTDEVVETGSRSSLLSRVFELF